MKLGDEHHTPQDTLDTFVLQRLDGIELKVIEFTTHELTALCPVTKQPDLYTCRIAYTPQDFAIETKSLKLYLWSFRDRGIFAEHLAQVIARDVHDAADALHTTVELTQQVRGGIVTTVRARAA